MPRKDGDWVWEPGDTIRVQIYYASSDASVDTDGGTTVPTVQLRLGLAHQPQARLATYAHGSGTGTLSFEYTVIQSDGMVYGLEVVEDSLRLNGGSIRNRHGNDVAMEPGIREVRAWSWLNTPVLFWAFNPTALEGRTMEFPVELVRAVPFPVTVAWATSDGTARAGEDYQEDNGTLEFAPGETRKTVEITLPLDDDKDEEKETLKVDLFAAVSPWPWEEVELRKAQAEGYIVNDPRGIPHEDEEETEGASGSESGSESPEGKAREPLTAEFSRVPARHDGKTPFSIRIGFSEAIKTGETNFRDHSVSVATGRVTGAKRVNGRSDQWEITIKPSSMDAVTVSLTPGSDCDVAGAVCTGDGRALSQGIGEVVRGPPPLTAEFRRTPPSHDGETPFAFRLRFSEEVDIDPSALVKHAFRVKGGQVTGAQRLKQGSSIRWQITVGPDSDGDVTVVLPPTTDCNAKGAVCTKDGRPLSHRTELTVKGPGG